MNDIDNSKMDLSQNDPTNESFITNKPKILKDSSKYVKKKHS